MDLLMKYPDSVAVVGLFLWLVCVLRELSRS